MKKVGFFGGSFDPIHFGHLNLALELMESHGLDEVWFCPTALSPHKVDSPPVASISDRSAMVRLAISPIRAFHCIDLELGPHGPFYTIDTVKKILTAHKDIQLFLLLGEDALGSFHKWKESEALVKLAPPLVMPRLAGISSTYVRERLRKKLFCSHLVPSIVLDYITSKSLYS